MKILRFEFKRAFSNMWFICSVVAGVAICIADCILFMEEHRVYGENALIQIWIGTDYRFAYNSLFYILLPLIASLPYAGTCYSDIKSGYDRNICVRVSRASYIAAKAVAVFVSGAITVGIPLLVDLFICAGLCPNRLPDKLSFLYAGIIDCNLFPRLFALHPVLYCIVFILIDAIFGGLVGLVAMCVARWSGSRFSTIMGPFALYLFTGVLFEGDGLGTWSALNMINPIQNVVTYGYQIVTMYVALCVVSLVLIYIWHRRRDII